MDTSNTSTPEDEDHRRRPLRACNATVEDAVLLNRQRAVRGDWSTLRRFLEELRALVAGEPFSVCLVSDAAMRRYNSRFRGVDKATDVLSFPAGGHGPGAKGFLGDRYLGDIVISVETARANARAYRVALEDELKLLSLHGVLHLMGYDHETDSGEMGRAERMWCRRLGLPASLTARARPKTAAQGGRKTSCAS